MEPEIEESSRALQRHLSRRSSERDSVLTWVNHRQPEAISLGERGGEWLVVRERRANKRGWRAPSSLKLQCEVKIGVEVRLRYRLGTVSVEGARKFLGDGGGGGVLDC